MLEGCTIGLVKHKREQIKDQIYYQFAYLSSYQMDNSGNNEIITINSIKLLHNSWIRRKKKIYFSSSNIFFQQALKDPSDCTSFSESGSLFHMSGPIQCIESCLTFKLLTFRTFSHRLASGCHASG